MNEKKINVLMIGPARSVKGGMTSVVDEYYEAGIDKLVNLKYIETINDKNIISKFIAERKGFIEFKKNIDKFDLVHIHMASYRSAFRKAKYIRIAKKYNKKIIAHMHGGEFKVFLSKCNKKQKKYIINALNMCDIIIVLSDEWKEFYSKYCNSNKIKIVYNGTVIPKKINKDYNNDRALYLGKFCNGKGIYDLIDAVENISKKYKSFVIYAGGDGEISSVKKIVNEKNLKKYIKVLGWIDKDKKEKYLRECSIFILPSYNEGMPMSIIEAMAYKNAVISTNVGGIPQVIDNNKNGILIEPGDKKQLYNSIEKLIKDKKFKEKIGNAGYEKANSKFNIENNINEIYSIYRELMMIRD